MVGLAMLSSTASDSCSCLNCENGTGLHCRHPATFALGRLSQTRVRLKTAVRARLSLNHSTGSEHCCRSVTAVRARSSETSVPARLCETAVSAFVAMTRVRQPIRLASRFKDSCRERQLSDGAHWRMHDVISNDMQFCAEIHVLPEPRSVPVTPCVDTHHEGPTAPRFARTQPRPAASIRTKNVLEALAKLRAWILKPKNLNPSNPSK